MFLSLFLFYMKDSYLLTVQITFDIDNYLPNFYMSAMDGSSEI